MRAAYVSASHRNSMFLTGLSYLKVEVELWELQVRRLPN